MGRLDKSQEILFTEGRLIVHVTSLEEAIELLLSCHRVFTDFDLRHGICQVLDYWKVYPFFSINTDYGTIVMGREPYDTVQLLQNARIEISQAENHSMYYWAYGDK